MIQKKLIKALGALRKESFYMKAQTTQVFFFILAIIIIGMLLLFGVKYIMELGKKVEQIDLVRFKTDIEGYAEEIRPVYGRWKKLEIDVPRGIDRVCFVQHERYSASGASEGAWYKTEQGLCQGDHEDYNFLICQAWQDDETQNVYTVPFVALDVSINVGSLDVEDVEEYYLCLDTRDHYMKIKMTGYGDYVHIEEWI